MAIPKLRCGICGAPEHPTSAHIAMNEHDGKKAFEEILRFVGEEKLLAHDAERLEFEEHMFRSYSPPEDDFQREFDGRYVRGYFEDHWVTWKAARGIE